MTAEIKMLQRYVHNTKQRFQFYEFVRDKYTDSRLNDTQFAAMASIQLNYRCTSNQVHQARKDFNILSNVPKYVNNPDGINGTIIQRIKAIEDFLSAFEPNWRNK